MVGQWSMNKSMVSGLNYSGQGLVIEGQWSKCKR